MERIYSLDLKNHNKEDVLVKGHIFQKRMMGKVNFIILRDRDGLIQIVLKDPKEISKVQDLMDESVIEVQGICTYDERSLNKAEIHDPKITVISKVTEPLKIEINKPEIHANIDTILDNRPIVLRAPRERAIFKIQATMAEAYREYAIKDNATEIFPPTIVGSATEGGSELFKFKYYGKDAYLSQSAQLYKQIMVGVFEKVFAIAHSYRAEKYGTSRHTSEFIQYEFEMGFINSYLDIISFCINVIRYIRDKVEKENVKELEILQKTLPTIPKDVPIIKLKEAQKLIFQETRVDRRSENDLSPEDEKTISKIAMEKYKSDLIVITHYPTSKRPFYTMPDPEDPDNTLSFDFILRGEEIATGGQRINNYNQLIDSIKKKGMNPNDFTDFLEIFKYGMPEEGGFGMGFERLTQQFLGLQNVREATLFPRDVKRISP
ncbi:MAG: aspartate--tRNA(Asn) ligase [Patescibacteria group bacterium]